MTLLSASLPNSTAAAQKTQHGHACAAPQGDPTPASLSDRSETKNDREPDLGSEISLRYHNDYSLYDDDYGQSLLPLDVYNTQ